MVRVCLVLQKPPNYFPKWLYHFAFLSAGYEISCCSTSSPAFGVFSFLNFRHLLGVQWYLVLICTSLITYDVEHFICLFAMFIFIGEVSAKVFALVFFFFNQVVCFIIVGFYVYALYLRVQFLEILDNCPLLRMSFVNVFSQSVFFHSFDNALCSGSASGEPNLRDFICQQLQQQC